MTSKKNADTPAKKNPFSVMEEEVLKFWEDNKIFEQSVEKEAPNGDYVFYDGPPFITGLPHYATLLPSIAKDVIPRYWTMKGYRVERVWGWDCHGLPAENKVEKELELKNKKDIEELGVDKFVDACRNYVRTGSEQWKWYIDRIGRWVDMDNAYKTMDLNFMESVIWAFKKLYDDGYIYEGHRSSLHCPRCATPLSKFEITMDAGSYKDVDDETVTVKFKVTSRNVERITHNEKGDLYILAWTTTPWTLPGNLALAVGNDLDYTEFKIKYYDSNNKEKIERIIIGNSYIEKLIENGGAMVDDIKVKISENDKNKNNYFYEQGESYKGKDLIGLEYEPVFDLKNEDINNNDKAYKVYHADFVNTEEGTGIVHIAPNFGEDDFNLGKEVGLPMIDLMDESGIYTANAGEFVGQYFKKANTKVLEELGEKIFSQERYKHSYPFCYRCSNRLIFRSQKAWYLKIDKLRQQMLDNNKKDINWVPDYFKEGRFHNNIEKAPDWCLSRSRYWGSPIPVWRCECGEMKVLGSIEEIEKLSGEKVKDLHRPEIDNIKIDCACGKKMQRVVEVLDCWFESGSMPFAQFHYPFKRNDEWKNIFPADFIIEYTGQLRGWFYYLHVLSNALFDSVAFKNVIVTGVLAGTDGRKMSKSFGNYPDPKMTLDKYGSDALRMYFMGSPIMTGGDMSLSEKDIQDSLRKNIILLWNVAKFFAMFRDEYKEKIEIGIAPESDNVLDKWIIIRLEQLKKEVTDNLERYNLPSASRPITDFISDLSTWYLRRSRDRFKSGDAQDKKNALETTAFVLVETAKIIAPFMPFMAEQVWQKVSGNEFKDGKRSVHLEAWSSLDSRKEIAEDKSKQEVDSSKQGMENDERVLKDMEMVRKIVELALAKRDEAGVKVRQPLAELKVYSQKLKVSDEYKALIIDEVNVKQVTVVEEGDELAVELDTVLTEELKQEGMKRELVRLINSMRKKAGLTIGDKVKIYYESASEMVQTVLTNYKNDILEETLAEDIVVGLVDEVEGNEVKANGEVLTLGILKI